MVDVKGKWALITGANRGIGYRIAIFMAQHGCNLILHSRSLEHTKDVLAEVKSFGIQAFDVAAELSQPAQIQKMIDLINLKMYLSTFFLMMPLFKLLIAQNITKLQSKIIQKVSILIRLPR